MVHRSTGVRGKLSALRRMALIGTRSHLRTKGTAAAEPDVKANAWSDYFLLSFVNRDVNVRLDASQPRRLWIMVPELNASVIFGGYIALFQFMRFMQARGVRIGVLVLNEIEQREALLRTFSTSPVAHGVLSASDITTIGIGRTLRLHPGDMLLAYNWTTSIVAAKMARFLDDPAYYYFAQEDERIFYANDSYRFLAESLFHAEPRPRLICNSALLADHFRAAGLVDDRTETGIFEQGLPPAPLPTVVDLSSRSPRRFVFYGRPEDHAKRNLMSIALMAIARARRDRVFAAEPWEFFMMGSSRMGDSFDLEGIKVTCLRNMDYDSYRKALTGFDVGMSLMYAPHPSVPPFEMVRSGIVTVVNTMPLRDADWYRSISANFEPAAPTVEGLAAAIGRAVARVGDVQGRLAAATSHHPASWDESFARLPGQLSHTILQQGAQE